MAKMEGLRQLAQIRAYAKNIIEALEDETLDSFIHTKSNMLQDAISYRFLIMGECAETILRKYPKVEMKYPKLPLRAMRGMRRYLCDYYSGPDYLLLWNTAENELPDLIDQIDGVLRDNRDY